MDVQKKSPIDEFFSSQGPLNDCLDNYQLREEQVEMAKSVSHAIAKKKSFFFGGKKLEQALDR